ncbi:MAG: hypothetical protein GX265_03895 [Mollicutes bacterium]|nr:hypothetical protein [Mollicutes bacterium]
MDTNINNAVPVEDKRGMNKTVKAVILVLVIILTILAGIAIGYGLFKLVNPTA